MAAGRHYDYRLSIVADGAGRWFGEASVDVPAHAALSLAGPEPNPASGDLRIAFTLASREPATLALFDLAGRKLRSIEVSTLGPGRHVVAMSPGARVPNGVYLIRLTQGGRSIGAKATVMR